MITAKFGSKKFEVSNKKIYTPNGLTIGEELDIEEIEVSGKKPTVNVKGIKLKPMSFNVKLDARFVDVITEMRFWQNTLLGKKSELFVLGDYTLGKFFLTKYDATDIVINKDGVYISATLSLAFTEDGDYANNYKVSFETPAKVTSIMNSVNAAKITKGCTVKPRSGARWYYTAEGALKKTGKSGKAYQEEMIVTHTYLKDGKIVCVNLQGLGWLKVEDVTFVKAAQTASVTLKKSGSNVYVNGTRTRTMLTK